MKTKRFFLFGLPVLLLALGLALAGCGGDDGDDGGDDGLNLPGIGDEPTTGQKTVTGSGITVSGEGMPQTLVEQTDNYTGAKFSITGGKFSFTLPENPTNPQVLADNESLLDTLFYDRDAEDYTTTPAAASDATFVSVTDFYWNSGSTSYSISREAYKEEETYWDFSEIAYVYVNKDVTLGRAAKNLTDHGVEIQVGVVNLALKKGWNLVQKDGHGTESGDTYTEAVTVKIADKNVPWTLDVYEDEPGPEPSVGSDN
jgi:hypothetical protein